MQREPTYGISWHVMKAAVDEGELLAQRFFDVSPSETSLTINTKCYEAAIESFGPLCDALASGSAAPLAQDLGQKSYFGKWQRPPAACTLDFTRPAIELEALVRALDFGRYENPLGAPKIHHRGRVFSVAGAQAQDGEAAAAPGTVLAVEADALVVATGDRRAASRRVLGAARQARVELADLVAALGVAPGTRLDGTAGGLGERLGSLNAELCRSEEFWVRRLASLDPLEPPYLRSDRAVGASEWRELALEVPAEFSARIAGGGDALVAGFVAWLARLCGRTSFDLAFRDDALRARVSGLEAFAADVVPLRIALDETGTAESAFAKSLDAIANTRKRGTFLHDAVARFPRLRGRAELAAGRLLPLLAEIRGDAQPIVAPEGTLLALVAAPDGRSARLGYDARALDEASARLVVRAVARVPARRRRVAVAALREASAARARRARARARDLERDRSALPDRRLRPPALRGAGARARPNARPPSSKARRSPTASSTRARTGSPRTCAALGVGPDVLVGVCRRALARDDGRRCSRIHKAGGAYVPLDPAYPADRIAFMLEDARRAGRSDRRSGIAARAAGARARAWCDSTRTGRAIATRVADAASRAASRPRTSPT